MRAPTVLICDDEPTIGLVLTRTLEPLGFSAEVVTTLAEAEKRLRAGDVDILFLDIFLPDRNGLEALPEIRRQYPKMPVIVLTAHGTMRTALEAMKQHAFEYLTKPFDLEQVRAVAQRAIAARRRAVPTEPVVLPAVDGEEMIGNSPPMQEVFKTIGRVVNSDVTVLIQGESGTGKELVARAIHANSPRSSGPFVALNCAAIPETLLESELFGHVRGAFTNAVSDRKGRLEQAAGGTLFLDEIGELPWEVQSKLLRVLQDRTFQPLGSTETRVADVRIIAATNRDLREAVARGTFREDLFYRLNVVTITLPPLRRRREDIPALAEFFVRKYSAQYDREPPRISEELMERLMAYRWPGNVRELENALHRAVVMGRGPVLTPEDVPLLPSESAAEPQESVEPWLRRLVRGYLDAGREGTLHEEVLQAVEVPLFRLVLEETGGNKSRAAEILGINRNTLHAKMKRYQMLGAEKD